MKNMLSEQLINNVWRALLGEIYPSIRAVALRADGKYFLIRYYLDRDPVEKDTESIETVAMNFSSMLPNHEISQIDVELLHSTEPIGLIDPLDCLIYARREYE